jgi:hypothetical protein
VAEQAAAAARAAAQEEAEQAAAAAHAAAQAAEAAHAAASAERTTASSLLDSLRSGIMPPRPPTHWRVGSFGGPRLFLTDRWGRREGPMPGGWPARRSNLMNAAARMRSNRIFAELRAHALESTDLDPPSRLESPSYTPEASPPESPISRRTRVQDDAALQRWLTPATPPESPSYSPQATPPESPTSTSPMIGVAYLDYSPEPRRHRPSTVWR